MVGCCIKIEQEVMSLEAKIINGRHDVTLIIMSCKGASPFYMASL